MRQRRWIIIASAFVLVIVAGLFLLQNGPLAQPPPPPPEAPGGPGGEMGPGPPPPGMEPGMEMGPGGPGGGGGGEGGLEWSAEEPPEELAMTYDDFIAKTGQPPTVPDALTVDEEGEPLKTTFNAWSQLQRVYTGRAEIAAEEVEPGRVGSRLVREAEAMAAYKLGVNKELTNLYIAGLNGFSFKVSHPLMGGMSTNAEGNQVTDIGPIDVLVIMQVRSQFQRTYGQKVYDRLKKYDCLGRGTMSGDRLQVSSAPFTIYIFDGGFFRPRRLNLSPEVAGRWTADWMLNSIVLMVRDRAGKVIYWPPALPAGLPAGQGPDIMGAILNPPEFYYSPKWRLLIPPEDLKWQGGRLNLNGTKGWTYRFSFSLPARIAKQMHSASAMLLPSPDILGRAMRGQLTEAQVQALEKALSRSFRDALGANWQEALGLSDPEQLVQETMRRAGARETRGAGQGAPGGPEMMPEEMEPGGPGAPPVDMPPAPPGPTVAAP